MLSRRCETSCRAAGETKRPTCSKRPTCRSGTRCCCASFFHARTPTSEPMPIATKTIHSSFWLCTRWYSPCGRGASGHRRGGRGGGGGGGRGGGGGGGGWLCSAVGGSTVEKTVRVLAWSGPIQRGAERRATHALAESALRRALEMAVRRARSLVAPPRPRCCALHAPSRSL